MCFRSVKIAGVSVKINGLYHDSRQVQPGGLYFALRDTRYISEAVEKGAFVVVTNDAAVVLPKEVTKIIVSDVRSTMALAAKEFYGNVADKMRISGVVGTNGKTTTSYILREILERAFGRPVGLIGTNGIFNAGKDWNSIATLTTPDPIDLHHALFDMFQNGVRDVVMEVSAHAIYYHKVDGINFDGVIFTNITQDHLDFFGNFENYKNTKLGFFRKLRCGNVIVNADDKYGRDVVAALKGQSQIYSTSYSLQNNLMSGVSQWAFVEKVKMFVYGSDFYLSKIGQCHLSLPGRYNICNAVGAALLALRYDVSSNVIKQALAKMPAVPGRFNFYNINGVNAIIDFAHTPDGLRQLLQNVRLTMSNNAKLWVVFGCGGDRDRGKRPLMGKIAYQLADYIVLTSDNSRTEEPAAIMDEIERGIITTNTFALENYLDENLNKKSLRFVDREKAIQYAINHASVGDVVVIAGKGHENYIEINHQKIPYMDSKVLDNILRGKCGL